MSLLALGGLLPALVLTAAPEPAGRIAGVVGFLGAGFKLEPAKAPEPACKGAGPVWERRALVRLTSNAPARPAPAAVVVLEEQGCRYRPWLQGAVKGQRVELRNLDPTTHSVRAAAQGRTLFNVIQPPQAKPLRKELSATGLVTVGCDLHPWSRAYLVVSEHPFFAVTADDGSFEINDVPPGSYGIEAWNDRLGTLRAEITVAPGQIADPKFSFSGPPPR